MARTDLAPSLAAATERFALLVATSDPDAATPSCPGWTVADLVDHVGGVHAWARHAVVERDGAGDPAPAPDAVRADPVALASWYRDRATLLVDTLRDVGPGAPAWVFGDGEPTAGWWLRRQVHETILHTWDLLASSGLEAGWRPDPGLAWDGVDEVATMFYPRQVRLGRSAPLAGTVRLRPTDVPAGAPVLLGSGGPVVDVVAPAADVLLAVWRRTGLPGDAASLLDGRAITP